MFSRWCRLFVAFAAAFAVWSIATPAFAGAPLCDPRGATVMAPAPQLQEPETSIDVGVAPDDCADRLDGLKGALKTAEGGRIPPPAPPNAAGDPVVPTFAPAIVAADFELHPILDEGRTGERPGARTRLERPPRP
jgi:hypothetical protein